VARTGREREILDAVTDELAADASFNAEHGKRVVGVRLEGEYPQTRIVLDVEERRPPLTLNWSLSNEIWDGSWGKDELGEPQPGSVAACLATHLMESTAAIVDCVTGDTADHGQRTLARLEVDHFDECLRFYRDGMSFCTSLRTEQRHPPRAELGLGNSTLTLLPRTELSGGHTDQEQPARLSDVLMLLRVPSLHTALESLQPWGAVIGDRKLLRRHQQALHVNDPDGNLIQLTNNEPSQAN